MKLQILAPGALQDPWRSEIGMNEAGASSCEYV
jgi:hypothetical protein